GVILNIGRRFFVNDGKTTAAVCPFIANVNADVVVLRHIPVSCRNGFGIGCMTCKQSRSPFLFIVIVYGFAAFAYSSSGFFTLSYSRSCMVWRRYSDGVMPCWFRNAVAK